MVGITCALTHPCAFLLAVAGIAFANLRRGQARNIRVPLLGAAAEPQPTAQSGTISHSTTVNVTVE
jgi:hypothetical protein